MSAFKVIVDFNIGHPARYHLLFNNPSIAAQRGGVEHTALATLAEFVAIVQDCQNPQELPKTPSATLAGSLLAAMQGSALPELENVEFFLPMRRKQNDAILTVAELVKQSAKSRHPKGFTPRLARHAESRIKSRFWTGFGRR